MRHSMLNHKETYRRFGTQHRIQLLFHLFLAAFPGESREWLVPVQRQTCRERIDVEGIDESFLVAVLSISSYLAQDWQDTAHSSSLDRSRHKQGH